MDDSKIAISSKAKIWLRVVAAFELFAGVTGVLSLPVLLRFLTSVAHPLFLFYVILTLANLLGGVLLWRSQRTGILLSVLLQLFQIPYYGSAGFPYNPIGLSFVLKAGWMTRDGVGAYELGINLVPVGLFVLLLVLLSRGDTNKQA